MLRSTLKAVPKQRLLQSSRVITRVPLTYSVHRLHSTSAVTSEFAETETSQPEVVTKNNIPNNTEPLNGKRKRVL